MGESLDTRGRLIRAAERLFAERGIDGVSLRQINVAAGQRNASASHYHFGSKQALIEAILEDRMARVNARRLEILDQVDRGGRSHDLRAVVEAVIQPFFEEIHRGENGRNYIRFVAQIYGDPRLQIAEVVRGRHDEGLQRAAALVLEILAHLPVEIVVQRQLVMVGHMIYSLADWERALAAKPPSEERAADTAVFVSDLIDTIVGALTAPLSEATRERLRERERSRAAAAPELRSDSVP